MKFSGRRWWTLVATDIVVRLVIWAVAAPLFFVFGPVFSCLHLVLLGLASKITSMLARWPLPAFVIILFVTNAPFLAAAYGFLYLIVGHEKAASGLGFPGYFQVTFNILLVLTFWLDQRFGGDKALQRGDDIYVVTEGYGTGDLRDLNQGVAPIAWKALDFGIRSWLNPAGARDIDNVMNTTIPEVHGAGGNVFGPASTGSPPDMPAIGPRPFLPGAFLPDALGTTPTADAAEAHALVSKSMTRNR